MFNTLLEPRYATNERTKQTDSVMVIGCVSPQFYHNISNGLKDVMWKPESGIVEGDEARQRRSP